MSLYPKRPTRRAATTEATRTALPLLLVAALLVWTTTRFQRKHTFSVLTMTYSKRRALLDGFVAHFSACPSIDSIVVVWNGADIDVVDTTSVRTASQVPVRFRVEPNPSMNNRYKPDPELDSTLLIIDDDLRIDCESIQRALDSFHRSRRRNIVGWFPRFAVLPAPGHDNDNPSSYSYVGEPGTVRRGEYNMVLSGAAIVDTGWLELYSSSELAGLRELVDDVWNCDDILFNFVVASAGGGTTYLRPRSLVDLSHETGVGISHDEAAFVQTADYCLERFHDHFQLRLNATPFLFSADEPPPDCDEQRSRLFCRY